MQICSNCAEELRGQCQVRQREPVEGCTQAVSVLLYQGKVRRALLTCKYGKKMVIGKWGGGQIAACLRQRYSGMEAESLITYVPTTFSGIGGIVVLICRRFLQSKRQSSADCPVSALCIENGLQNLSSRLTRCRADGKMRPVRTFRARGVISWGKRVLLVDDVLTSGATASTCAAILREMGADEVFFISLAKMLYN